MSEFELEMEAVEAHMYFMYHDNRFSAGDGLMEIIDIITRDKKRINEKYANRILTKEQHKKLQEKLTNPL